MSDIWTRRSLLQSAGLVGLAGIVTERAAALEPNQGEQFKSRFGEAKVLVPGVRERGPIPGNISLDGLRATIQFADELDASINVDVEPHSVTKVTVLEVPVTVPDPKDEFYLGYSAWVTGSVRKGEGTRVVLSLDLGGSHHVVEYPFGKSYEGKIDPDAFFSYSKTQDKQVEGANGEQTMIRIPTPPHYTAILVVSIQRRTPKDDGFVRIDNLDLEIIRPLKYAKSPQHGGPGSPARNKKATPQSK